MRWFRFPVLASLALAVGFGAEPRSAWAQDPPKKDEALEKLLEKLETPKPTGDPEAKPKPEPDPTKKDPLDKPKFEPPQTGKPTEPTRSDPAKPESGGDVGSKDQSLDKLLEGLGGADDKPAPDDKKGGGGPGQGEPPPPKSGSDAKPNPLDDAQKSLDELLEEKTGKKPKKPKKSGQSGGQGQGGGQDEPGGPMGDLIKQMRDVENRLGKPDTGEETRKKQSEIVKNLETLLEQMRSSSQSQAMKMVRGGAKPGGPPEPGQGNQPGSTGQGTGMSKPTPPKTPPAPVELAKEVWGQLPSQFRDDMANVLNENPLPGKADLIRLYYLSLGKKSATRGE